MYQQHNAFAKVHLTRWLVCKYLSQPSNVLTSDGGIKTPLHHRSHGVDITASKSLTRHANDADSRSMGVNFVRIGVFGKDAIDQHKLNKVILFQAIGKS